MIDINIGLSVLGMLTLTYPTYVLLMSAVLSACGVPREDVAKWALRQADRQRLTDLVHAARGGSQPPDEEQIAATERTATDS
jgi:hypothetical protein